MCLNYHKNFRCLRNRGQLPYQQKASPGKSVTLGLDVTCNSDEGSEDSEGDDEMLNTFWVQEQPESGSEGRNECTWRLHFSNSEHVTLYEDRNRIL